MKRSYASPETSKLIGGVDVNEQRRLGVHLNRLELAQRGVQCQLAAGETSLEDRKRASTEGGRHRLATRRRRFATGVGESEQHVGGHARHVDREDDSELGRRGPETSDDAGERGSRVGAVVDELERQL